MVFSLGYTGAPGVAVVEVVTTCVFCVFIAWDNKKRIRLNGTTEPSYNLDALEF